MHQSLASVLLPEYRRRVLGLLLLLQPDQALHGREIARRMGLAAGTVARELTKLAAMGWLNREKRGNQQVYSANTAGPAFSERASILRKTSGLADGLAEALQAAAKQVQIAFVFGSMAPGVETAGSDIDLLLIGDLSFADAVELLHPAQAALDREVNPSVFNAAEFKAKASRQAFLRDVRAKPKIFAMGGDDELAKLVGDQP